MKARDVVAYLSVLIKPSWWVRNYGVSHALSEFIEHSLEEGVKPIITGTHTMTLGGVELWRENFPYAYGKLWNTYGPTLPALLPSRPVAMRLRRAELAVVETDESIIQSVIAKATGESQ